MNVFEKLLNSLKYPSPRDNIINYTILAISIILLFYEYPKDKKLYILLACAIVLQLSTCYVVQCVGISMIYCILFGYLFMKKYSERKTRQQSYRFLGLFIVLLAIVTASWFYSMHHSGVTVIATAIPIFYIIHFIFFGLGAGFSKLKINV